MSIDPAKLAQMDREKALWDSKLNELLDAYKHFREQSNDATVAYFDLMEALSEVDDWKLMATLAAAVLRLAS